MAASRPMVSAVHEHCCRPAGLAASRRREAGRARQRAKKKAGLRRLLPVAVPSLLLGGISSRTRGLGGVGSGTSGGTSCRRCVGRLGSVGGRGGCRSRGRSCGRGGCRSSSGRGGCGSGGRLGFFLLATGGNGQSEQRSNEEGFVHGGVSLWTVKNDYNEPEAWRLTGKRRSTRNSSTLSPRGTPGRRKGAICRGDSGCPSW